MYDVNWNTLEATIAAVKRIAQSEVMPRFLNVAYSRKYDGTLFTEADLASQEGLKRELPGILNAPVLGEEMSDEEQLALWESGHDGLWCVDPIDGTTNFVHGLPYFAISVAFLQKGRPVLGVIYNPCSDETFYAMQGVGAFMNGTRLPLKNHRPAISEAVAGVELKWLPGKLPARLMTVAPFGSQRNLGASTLDWCWVAAGRFDLILHGGQRLWDYAAGALILIEAGGRLGSIHHEDFWSDNIWRRSAIAALDPALFECWQHWVHTNK
ncbi:myo-inositol-1(or 4)-monophosphatase [Chitinivorax tropicus]|uniref:Myo-inositol-1(Or 4)-monophosphatase n=1 Tax=Chitinivorax tropicus TaxID=714531 RepID=A0A840MPR6_9PROT|nr:inositol monophosphatase family protein [Chitinivorax tropicus]MBB5017241.1 myo-inositol-1(or 4)-monophosphatase [Chitinivorax tropicus]